MSVEPLSIDQARRRLVAELARCLPTEEHVVAFLLELQPIRGSWELVEMARHAGQEIDKFWQLGVLEWLGRDEEGERLAELNRILRVLVSYEGDAVEGAPTGPSTEED